MRRSRCTTNPHAGLDRSRVEDLPSKVHCRCWESRTFGRVPGQSKQSGKNPGRQAVKRSGQGTRRNLRMRERATARIALTSDFRHDLVGHVQKIFTSGAYSQLALHRGGDLGLASSRTSLEQRFEFVMFQRLDQARIIRLDPQVLDRDRERQDGSRARPFCDFAGFARAPVSSLSRVFGVLI